MADCDNPTRQRSVSSSTKLRYACNNCHAAKVRCSGEKTGCRRCLSMNESCVFSVSMVGKVVGARGKYNQSKKRIQGRRQRDEDEESQTQQSSGEQHAQSEQAEKPTDISTQDIDSFAEQPQNKKHKQWPSSDRHSISPPLPEGLSLQPLQDGHRSPQASQAPQAQCFDPISRQQSPSMLGLESPDLSADSGRNHSPTDNGTGDWSPIDLCDQTDVFSNFVPDFVDLLAYNGRELGDSSTPIRTHEPMEPSRHMSMDSQLLDMSNLLGDENANFCMPQPTSAPTPPAARQTPTQNTVPHTLSPQLDLGTGSNIVPRTDTRPASHQTRRMPELMSYSRDRISSDSGSEMSFSTTPTFSGPKDQAYANLRNKCIVSSASILTTLETCLEGLRVDVGKESGVDAPTLDNIMETNRRTTEAVSRIMEYNSRVESFTCVRILIMAMELVTQILQDAYVKPLSAATSLNPTFGSYRISKSDQEWLRRRLLRTEVQRTFDLVMALRSSCAVGKFHNSLNPIVHDNCLQTLLRTLKCMLDDLGGNDH